MGAAQMIDIHGAKGGESKPKSPTEASDSLRSTNLAKILIAVGEGEFDEVPTDYDIYLDNTPIRDASGNYNFPNVKWDWRSGSVDQTYIPGIPSVENETSLNVELRSDAPWVRSISNIQLSAVRVRLAWPALQQQDNEGNIGGYRIDYAIDVATDGGAYQQVLVDAVDGKTTTRYERSPRINLPDATTGWQIRVRRLAPNQNSNKVADTMLIAGYTEVIDAKLRYPNTALLYIEFDAEQFTNIPAVTVKCRARRWQVPSNYDPIARTYTGTWDGSMKQAWTNNPAWITYGICTEDRFGLGKRIKSFMVDKWELYRIAQYADQLVPNGLGGVEPRFLCDMNLQGKADAWSLLRDIAGIYRGMTYWAQGQLVMQADMPRAQDFDYIFTRANVIDGKFSYGSASAKTRYTRALVSYDNPANNYDTDVIPFADLDLQRRMGDKPTELSAIGCTRASEAQRRGKWAILSNNQDRTISFKTGMEGVIPLPGHIIPVADSLLAGREVGGRISAAAGRVVTLDRDTQAKTGDRLIINLPGGRAEGRTVQSVSGRAVTVTTNYSEPPLPQLQWALDADDLAIPLYRVLSTRRTAEGDFEISALQYDPSKFAYIDTGARLEERPISVIPITVVPAPASVTVTSNSVVSQGIAVATMIITWPAVNGAVGYDVEWRKDSGNWIKLQRTGMTSVDVVGIYAGAYLARVRAVSSFDISSIWRSSILTNLKGKEGLPPAVSFLTATPLLFGIGLKWGFPAGAEDTQRTEIWYGPTTSLELATKLTDLSYPQSDYSMQSLLAGASFFFWARLIDRTGNVGPWYPTGMGVMGQASADAGPILDQIAGQIGETELGQDLLDRIELIDGPPTLAGSVAQKVAAEALARAAADLANANAISKEVTDRAAAVLAEAQARAAEDLLNAGKITKEATDRAAAILAEATARGTAITSEANTRSSADSALSTRIDTVTASTGGNAAAIQTEITARTNADSALGTRIDTVAASTASNLAAIGTEITARTNADSALGTRIDTVVATATTDRTNASAAVTGEATARASADTALGSRVDTVSATLAGKADASAVTELTTRVTAAEGVNTSQGTAITGLQNALPGKADASALNSLTTRVTSAEGAITSQGTSLTGLSNSLTTTNGNVTAAQNAANAASTLAGGKGKVLVQTATPAVADQLAQNLWIDITGNANTPKRWNGSAWAAVTDKVATDAAAAAANALSVANTKADSAAVTALTSRVTAAEGTITSQGSNITSLTNSLTVTNGNVTTAQNAATAAQTAAQSASDLAGGKGKVLAQSATPGAAEQLVQNLWIDTTGGANTPKRWTGSAWSAVTDKVATDAAAAAANALSVANTKADASAVSSLTSRVTSAEGTINSQGASITSINNSIGSVGGENLLYNPSFEKAGTTTGLADGWQLGVPPGATAVPTLVQSGIDPAGVVQRLDVSGLSVSVYVDTTPIVSKRPSVSVGQVLTMSSSVRATTGMALRLYFQFKDSAGATLSTDGPTIVTADGTWQRISRTAAAAPANTVSVSLLFRIGAASTPAAGFVEWDRAQLEIAPVMTGWKDNTKTLAVDQTATSAALSTLSSTVTQQGTALTSQGNSLAQLTNRVTDAEGVNSGQATAISSLDTRVTSTEGQITAQATKLDGIYVQVNPELAGDTTGFAGSTSSLVGVWSEQSARIEDGLAIGKRVDTVQVAVNDNTATVQQVSQSMVDFDGKASAMWSVKLQVNSQGQYVAAGIGLGIENGPAGLQSQFLVSADRFAVVNGINGNLSVPFAVQGGQVFLGSTFIQDGTITNAKIGSYISSTNYIAGQQGWILNKDGTLEINGIVPGQGRLVINSLNVSVYDANNVLRVRLGYLG